MCCLRLTDAYITSFVLEAEQSDECVDFTMMVIFLCLKTLSTVDIVRHSVLRKVSGSEWI